MNLLILGGTRFLGRALAETALERGHALTLFHRGQHSQDAFPQAEHIIGDRESGLELLQGRTWDAVIDTCGFVPRIVRSSVELLKDRVGHYTFISSVSVYEDLTRLHVKEDAPVAILSDASTEDVTQHYGALKALCEKAVEAAMPGRALHIRPGLIVGPHDYSDRFTYWPHRIAQGGEVLVPPKEGRIQVIDVRDLAAWVINLVEKRTVGTFHASGSDFTMEQLVDACARFSSRPAEFTWVTEPFLREQQVGQWIELPLWLQSDSLIGMFAMDNTKAFASGLTTRPLIDTVRDTLAWDRSRSPEEKRKAGLEPAREAELLRLWRSRDDAAFGLQ
ncbi:NAD-dependent epimerase/dehydratase family protein [Paenibacillus oleatilyticus]|uniref:NAD-dependent epimerase/dehydratase family protein n=1 Tax=Paenibacillus oleatilyticus TaxID=2594886 RepID=UPI001C1F4357|nr:NAD-dependent epimerase/dehydratase family protein [Paenibacillus oleatilyticus]MBU7315024.1 epimerase [Paenibacillus oleatilyticus]